MLNKNIKSLVLLILLLHISYVTYGTVEEQDRVNKTLYTKDVNFAYTEHDPITIDSDDDFDTYGFPESGTKNDPYRIEELNITASASDGIYVYSTTHYFIIQNCLISGPEYGIYLRQIDGTGIVRDNIVDNCVVEGIGLWYSHHNLIEYNEISVVSYELSLDDSNYNIIKGNICPKIDLEDSDYNQIIDNECCSESSGDGIELDQCDHTIITGNTIQNKNRYGIELDGGYNTTISNNEISDNGDDGIYIDGSLNYDVDKITITGNSVFSNDGDGISVYYGTNATITNNECYSNNDDGINLSMAEDGLITGNLLQSNTNFGLAAFSAYDFVIHHNTFKYNGQSPQAKDDEGGCVWYDETSNEGNYWSDWDGTGEYEIAGPPDFSDPYPLSEEIPTSESEDTSQTSTNITSSSDSETTIKEPNGEPSSGFLLIYTILGFLSLSMIFNNKKK